MYCSSRKQLHGLHFNLINCHNYTNHADVFCTIVRVWLSVSHTSLHTVLLPLIAILSSILLTYAHDMHTSRAIGHGSPHNESFFNELYNSVHVLIHVCGGQASGAYLTASVVTGCCRSAPPLFTPSVPPLVTAATSFAL